MSVRNTCIIPMTMKTILSFFLLFLLALQPLQAQPMLFFPDGLDSIHDLLEMPNGDVWIATSSGIVKTDVNQASYQLNPSVAITSKVSSLATNGSLVLAGTMGQGVFLYDGNSWTQYTTANGLNSNTVFDIAVSSPQFYLATANGINRLIGNTISSLPPTPEPIVHALEVQNNTIYAGNRTGNFELHHLVSNQWIPFDSHNPRTIRVYSLDATPLGFPLINHSLILGSMPAGGGARPELYFNIDTYIFGSAAIQTNKMMVLNNNVIEVFEFLTSLSRTYELNNRSDTEFAFSLIKKANSNQHAWVKYYYRNSQSFGIGLMNTEFDNLNAHIENGRLKAPLSYNGDLFNSNFTQRSSSSVFEYHNLDFVFRADLFMGSASNGKATAISPQNGEKDYWRYWEFGPRSQDKSGSYLQKYARVWKISKAEIQSHIANVGQPGYQASQNLLTWPGNGDVTKGESLILAPFKDLNGNALYEPLLGEYPIIRGDEAVYSISHDRTSSFTSTIPVVGVEVHTMLYLYQNHPTAAVNNSLFVHFEIRNLDGNPIDAVGIKSDFDLNYAYGLMGTDSAMGLVYNYSPSYNQGLDRFTVGGMIQLGDTLKGSSFYTSTSHSSLIDSSLEFSNKTLWNRMMQREVYFGSILRVDNPSGPFSNLNGYGFSSPNGIPTTWQFNDQHNWYNPGDLVTDHRATSRLSIPAPSAQSNVLCLDLAYIIASDSNQTSTNLYALPKLKQFAQEVATFFSQQAYGTCLATGLDSELIDYQRQSINLYPNPTGDFFRIQSSEDVKRVEILSLKGQRILSYSASDIYGISSLSKGMYLVKIELESQIVMERLLVE